MNNYLPESAIINKSDPKRKKIAFTENNRVYECLNDISASVVMVHIDGGLFSKAAKVVRCDYGYEVDSKSGSKTCLVELKGHNISHACSQLLETITYFEKKYPVDRFYCRIVSSGNKKPNIESKEEKILSAYLRRKKYDKLKIGTNKISEKLSDLN